jgi:hypothetical protein
MNVMPSLPIAPRLVVANDPPPSYRQAVTLASSSSLPVQHVENREPLRAWQRARADGCALPANDPRLFHPASGVLPKKVMKELEHVLQLLEAVNVKAITESRRAERELGKATVKLEALKEHAPEPTAPLEMTVGSGLFDGDSSAGVDVVHQKTVRRAEKKVARLEKDMQALAKSFQDQVAALQIKKMKLEASLRPVRVTTASATR